MEAAEYADEFDGEVTGLENLTSRDLLVPRLTILQSLSPQVKSNKPEYDPDARAGDIYDIGMQERFPDGVDFLFVKYSKQWLEWAPRESQKGLQALHDTDAVLKQARREESTGRLILPNGNYIAETAQFYGFNVTANWRPSFLPMASTQLGKARRLLSWVDAERIRRKDNSEFRPPIYFRSYKLTTVPESNAKGDWFGWKIERGPALPEFPNWENHKEDAKRFIESIIAGEARGDMTGIEDHSSQRTDDGTI